jgi:hypothetical protein
LCGFRFASGNFRNGSKCETLDLSISDPLTTPEQTSKQRLANSLVGHKPTFRMHRYAWSEGEKSAFS